MRRRAPATVGAPPMRKPITDYNVNRFPLELTVDGEGVIERIGHNLDPPEVH